MFGLDRFTRRCVLVAGSVLGTLLLGVACSSQPTSPSEVSPSGSSGSAGGSISGSTSGGSGSPSTGNTSGEGAGSSSGGGAGDDAGAGLDATTPPPGDDASPPPEGDDATPPPPPAGDGGVNANWPQAGGPDGTFRWNAAGSPTTWSVAANQNILWKTTLDDEGQGGIAVWGDTLFLTTFPPYNGMKSRNDVEGYAIDTKTGMIKWRTKVLTGNGLAGPVAYQYSDATSWTPVTDGQYVWFFDSAGMVAKYDFMGNEIWRQPFAGQSAMYPFNRCHQPFFVGDNIVILSPLGMGKNDPTTGTPGWNYLHAIAKSDGSTQWAAQDGSTFYNTAVPGLLPDGTLAVVHGRGGPHNVPETPVGLSMTSLVPGMEGKSLWQYHAGGAPVCTGGSATKAQMCTGGGGTALYNMSWDKYAYWFSVPPGETVAVMDLTTGKQIHGWSLSKLADIHRWDPTMGKYVTMANVNVNNTTDWIYGGVMHVVPDWHANIAANGYVWFLAVTNGTRWGDHTGPPHSLGRVNVETGKVEYLELPVGVKRAPGMPEQRVYGGDQKTTVTDAAGHDLPADARSYTDGWSIPAFWFPPTLVGTKLYFSVTLGLTYVIDATAQVLDETALLGIGDMGPLGQTFALGGPSYAGGVMYHHDSKVVVAIKGQ